MNMYVAGGFSFCSVIMPSSMFGAADSEIASFATLPEGWHYGEGGPIPQRTIGIALRVVEYIRQFGLWDIDAFAGTGGEISAITSLGAYDIEAIIEADDTISVAHDYNRRQVSYRPRLTYQEAVKEISAIVGKAWSTFEYFIQGTTMSDAAGLLAWHSGIYAEAFPSSNMVAYNPSALVYQPTSQGTTVLSQPTPLYSGNSTRQFFLQPIP